MALTVGGVDGAGTGAGLSEALGFGGEEGGATDGTRFPDGATMALGSADGADGTTAPTDGSTRTALGPDASADGGGAGDTGSVGTTVAATGFDPAPETTRRPTATTATSPRTAPATPTYVRRRRIPLWVFPQVDCVLSFSSWARSRSSDALLDTLPRFDSASATASRASAKSPEVEASAVSEKLRHALN